MQRTLVMGLILAVISLAAGAFVASQTFPSDEEIQRISFEELGLDPNLLDQPLVRMIVEQIQTPVRERVLDESRQAMYLGGGTMVLVNVLGVALIAADHRRRGPSAE